MTNSIDWKLVAVIAVAAIIGGSFWLMNNNGVDNNLVSANGRIEM